FSSHHSHFIDRIVSLKCRKLRKQFFRNPGLKKILDDHMPKRLVPRKRSRRTFNLLEKGFAIQHRALVTHLQNGSENCSGMTISRGQYWLRSYCHNTTGAGPTATTRPLSIHMARSQSSSMVPD